MPMIMPPMTLMNTTSRPAMASPRTNLEAPSMAPTTGLGLVDHAGRQVGVDRHLLAAHRVEVEAGGDFGDTAGALGDDDEIHDHQDHEDDDADDEIAAHHEIAEGLD